MTSSGVPSAEKTSELAICAISMPSCSAAWAAVRADASRTFTEPVAPSSASLSVTRTTLGWECTDRRVSGVRRNLPACPADGLDGRAGAGATVDLFEHVFDYRVDRPAPRTRPPRRRAGRSSQLREAS